jgi:hypothetical protein
MYIYKTIMEANIYPNHLNHPLVWEKRSLQNP